MDKKYELLMDDSIMHDNTTLYRIRALRDFGSVKKGDLGGYIEKEYNLSQYSTSWVYGKDCVYGNSRAYGKSKRQNFVVSDGFPDKIANIINSGESKPNIEESLTKSELIKIIKELIK